MFYDRLLNVCEERNIKLTPLLQELGISKGNIKSWKDGIIPTGTILIKLSCKSEVSTDYLLGLTDNPEMNR